MASLKRALRLVSRPPSLRGHNLEGCIRREQTFRVFSVIERATDRPRWVYIANCSKSSIVGLVQHLLDLNLDFEVSRLRNGGVCCLSDVSPEASAATSPKERSVSGFRRVSLGVTSAVTSLMLLAIGMLLLPNLKGSVVSLPESPAVSSPPDCDQRLANPAREIGAFLENGTLVLGLAFDVVSSLQSGGLRSVRLGVTCEAGGVSSNLDSQYQEWRVTLAKSQLLWRVIKMTRLNQ